MFCSKMNVIGNMHEVSFPTIDILWNIIYYILPLTIIIVLAIRAVGFSKVRQGLSNIFAMHCGDIIEIFFRIFYNFRLKNWFLHVWRDEKKNKKTLNLFQVLNKLKKRPHLKSFFFDPHKNSMVCSAFNSPWTMETFWWATNPS